MCMTPVKQFSENVLLDGLYWEHWYDVSETDTTKDDNNILYENRLLGVPRARQVSAAGVYLVT